MRPGKPSKTVRRAKKLRRELTLPEAMLWKRLKNSQTGHRFRKQHPAGPHILDFFCARANLAIEIDGISHDMGDRPARDEKRDAWLKARRIETLRIPAKEVLQDVEAVVASIIGSVEQQLGNMGKAPPSSSA